jgi:hypothetical protein
VWERGRGHSAIELRPPDWIGSNVKTAKYNADSEFFHAAFNGSSNDLHGFFLQRGRETDPPSQEPKKP